MYNKIICLLAGLVLLSSSGCGIIVEPIELDFGTDKNVLELKIEIIGTCSFIFSGYPEWVTVNPVSGMKSQTVEVSVKRDGLEPGVYETSVLIETCSYTHETIFITMEVTEESLVAIEGFVYDDATDDLVQGVMVWLDSSSIVLTDDSGFYRINGVSTGTHTIHASKDGYYDYSLEITVDSDPTTTHDIYMEREYIVLEISL